MINTEYMKENMRRWLCICGAWLTVTAAGAQAIKVEHDKHNYNQVMSMEFASWGFSPKGDYYDWDYKKILGIKIPVPGNGWHEHGWCGTGINVVPNVWAGLAGHPELIYAPDNYVNEPWRLMSTQRSVSMSQLGIQKNRITTSKERWDDMMKNDILTIADRNGVISGALSLASGDITANDRQLAFESIENRIDSIRDPFLRTFVDYEYGRLKQMIYGAEDAHMDDARKTILLANCNRYLEDLGHTVANMAKVEELLAEGQKIMEAKKKRLQQLTDKYGWAVSMLEDFMAVQNGTDTTPFKIEESDLLDILNDLVDLKKL